MKKNYKRCLKILLEILWPSYMSGVNEHSEILILKYWFLQKILRINSHVPWPVHPTTKVISPEKIIRGDRTPGLGVCSHIDGRNGIVIGKNVWFGPRVSLISMNHDVNNFHRYIKARPIIIGDNCWLATNSTILPGVELGPHTIVAAGAVVHKSFPDGNSTLGGVPAKIIKHIPVYKNS